MSKPVRPLGRKGFTLVELLIVVAIIGILSTIGVPTFRRMMQKSKKSEAQVNLGGLYTAEQAFLSEYGGYGNNLTHMGFQIDGDPTQLTYTVGFFNATCVPWVNNSNQGVMPQSTSNGGTQNSILGNAILSSYPDYYAAAGAVAPYSAVGRVNFQVPNPVVGQPPLNSPGALAAQCLGANPPAQSNVYTATGDSDSFTAIAVGVVAPGISKTSPANATDTDVWTITQTRVVSNIQDGTH